VTFNRRQFVLAATALGALPARAVPSYSAEMPNMLVTYFARRLNDEVQHWDAERTKIQTAADMRARNQFVRFKLREMAGALPPKVALAARTTRILERNGYRIENVLFQSQPDYWIPANLYLPASGPGPFPAIALQRGHFDAERMSPDYQQLHYDLVKNGFVVLAYDSIGQGERRQHYESGGEMFEELLSPTLEHCVIGGLLSLIGESAAAWFAWDGMRAIDYLMERPEVDRAKIGCADHPDTGWNTLFHCALDDRIQCASIHAHGSGRRWPIEAALWNTTDDPEQFLFPAAKYGVDLPDVMAALAPRPLQILVDDPGGDFDNTAAYLSARFRQLGVTEQFGIEKARAGEDWPKALRNATVRWFRRWLKGDAGEVLETDVVPETYEALHVTPKGSLRESKIGKPIYSLIRERASHLPPAQTPAQLRDEIRRMLMLPPAAHALDARELSSDLLEGYRLSTVEFLSEPGIYVPGRLYRPTRDNGDCILYTAGNVTTFVLEVDDDLGGSAAKENSDPSHEFADGLARKGYTVLCVDVRGLGLTRPLASRRDIRGPYEHLHNSDAALANMAWSLGDSLFAMRVRDLLRAAEYASQFGRVRLAAAEMGALWALFVGAVNTRIATVSIQRGLASYRMLTEHGRYMQATSQFIPGILKRFDLPQVAGLIAPRPLAILDPTDHMNMAVDPNVAKQIYSTVQAAYKNINATKEFKLLFHEELEDQVTYEG
jgi:cephalosporin-C deacetylase-like acetyl esterase